MQEKAWSTGGLKKLILKLISENTLGYKSFIPTVNISPDAISIQFGDIRTNSAFFINHTKQTIIWFHIEYNYADKTFNTVANNISYNEFISNNTMFVGADISDAAFNSIVLNGNENNYISIMPTSISYENNDNVEVLYYDSIKAPYIEM